MTAGLHDRLLAKLQGVAQVALVSKLRDPRLNFPDPDRLTVFVPDLHLVTGRRPFLFRTNATATLAAVLRAVRTLKAEVKPSRVVLCQIGDLLDLWREADGFDPNVDVASAIEDSHSDLMEAIYDPDLDTQFLLGNHDYDLYRFPNYDIWQRYFYPAPSMLVMHGDVLDWVERLPDQLQQFFVYLFAPGVKPDQAQLRAMRDLNCQLGKERHLNRDLPGGVAPVRKLAMPDVLGDVDRFNVQDAQSPPAMLALFDAARKKCAEADARFGLSITTAVIGHTHHARIVVHEEGDKLFAMVDCGAWIENCVTEDDPVSRPNAQIGVVGANEVRIYQLAAL
jgi:UDP-2,3-diacylglucosamine pyrophosphatase LpxH